MAAIRFGLIGMGTHGMRYARHLMHDVEGVELYAVCRQDRCVARPSPANIMCATTVSM